MKNKLVIAIVILVVLLLFVIGYYLLKTYRSFKAYMLYLKANVISEENVDMAIKLLEQAIKLDPNRPEFR